MADDGPLSQADIDALTAGLLGGDAGGGFDPDALRPEADLFLEQGSSVIGALLSRGAALTLRELKAADASGLSEFGGEGLALHVTLEGLNGDLAICLSKTTAAMLAGLMMGGDGAAPFKDEDLDALNELGNQLMGSVCTALGGKHGLSVSTSQAKTSPLDPDNPPFPLDGAAMASADLSVDGIEPAPFHILFSRALVESLSGGASSGGGQSDSGSGGLTASPSGYDTSLARGMGDGEISPNVQMLLDINLNVTIELGRTRLSIRKILELGPGSIIELDRLAGEPVDLLVNDKVVAKGEVVVVDEYFGIRIISLVSPEERIKQLR
jgi:flagellar motor switch protein FliN/FliY